MSYEKCHFCDGEVYDSYKKHGIMNKKINKIIKIELPVWRCKECGIEVHRSESMRLLAECAFDRGFDHTTR